MIFSAHCVLGYSSNDWLANKGPFEEPMGRAHLQKLWQKYKVDIAFYGQIHNYERSCPIYQVHRSADGEVYDSFTISRDYRDVLACVHDGCEATTLAT
ncbi:putative phosphodiesterase I [Helianthus anomalus]